MFDKKGHTVRYLSSPKDLDIIKVVLNINRDEILKDILTNKKSSQKNNGSSDSNGMQIHNHLFRKRTLNHLAKISLKLQISRLFRARSSLTFRQLQSVDSL